MTDYAITRRQFVGGSVAASLLAGMHVESRAEGDTDGEGGCGCSTPGRSSARWWAVVGLIVDDLLGDGHVP